MSMLPLAIAVARMHINRAEEDGRRRARHAGPDLATLKETRLRLRETSIHDVIAEARATIRPDLVALCARIGVTVDAVPLRDDIAGWIDSDAKRFVVNSGCTPERRRFTIAHQIGHWFYDLDVMRRYGGTNDGLDYRGIPGTLRFNPDVDVAAERRATILGVGLIMPTPILRKMHAKGMTLGGIAERLETTEKALAIRMGTLGMSTSASTDA